MTFTIATAELCVGLNRACLRTCWTPVPVLFPTLSPLIYGKFLTYGGLTLRGAIFTLLLLNLVNPLLASALQITAIGLLRPVAGFSPRGQWFRINSVLKTRLGSFYASGGKSGARFSMLSGLLVVLPLPSGPVKGAPILL